MALTVARMQELSVARLRGKDTGKLTPKERVFIASLDKTAKIAKRNGMTVHIPSEWEMGDVKE